MTSQTVKKTTSDRDDLIRSLISSQALSGIHVTYEEADKILTRVIREVRASRPLGEYGCNSCDGTGTYEDGGECDVCRGRGWLRR
jgi:hypothetical protein